MTLIQSIILGFVQGLTEFLPISSSAHLVIVPYLLKWQIPPDVAFIFDVLVQVASLVAVIAYFWNDLNEIGKAFIQGIIAKAPFATLPSRLGWFLILSTIPAGLLGLVIGDLIEQVFNNPAITALFLFVTAGLLVIAEKVGKRNRQLGKIEWLDALWIGAFQALAIFPGISRSGATITGGMTRNFDRPSAARYAFLMSIPVMLAAGLFASLDLANTPNFSSLLPVFIPGFVTSAVISYLSIRWLLKFLIRHSLIDFAIYCVILATITLMTVFIRNG